MFAALIAFIIQLLQTLLTKAADTASVIWTAISDSGSGLLDGIVDWFNDDEVDLTEKLAAVAGIGYLIAPELTSDIISDAVEGAGETTESVIETLSDTADTFFSSTLGKYTMIGLAIFGVYLLLKE